MPIAGNATQFRAAAASRALDAAAASRKKALAAAAARKKRRDADTARRRGASSQFSGAFAARLMPEATSIGRNAAGQQRQLERTSPSAARVLVARAGAQARQQTRERIRRREQAETRTRLVEYLSRARPGAGPMALGGTSRILHGPEQRGRDPRTLQTLFTQPQGQYASRMPDAMRRRIDAQPDLTMREQVELGVDSLMLRGLGDEISRRSHKTWEPPSARDFETAMFGVVGPQIASRLPGGYQSAGALTADVQSALDSTIGSTFGRQLAEAFLYTPAGIYMLGENVGRDLWEAAPGTSGGPGFGRTRQMGADIGRAVYQDFTNPGDNPGYLAADILGLAGGLAGAGSRVVAATRAGRSGAGAGQVARLLRTGPNPGRRVLAPGVEVPRSRSALGRLLEDAYHKSGIQGVGPGLTFTPESRIGFQRGRIESIVNDIERAGPEALRSRARRVSETGQSAIRAVAEGTPLRVRIERHQADIAAARSRLTDGVTPKQRGKIQLQIHRLNRKIGRLERAEKLGYVTDTGGRLEVSGKLAEDYAAARSVARTSEQVDVDLGRLEPEQAARRLRQPGQAFRGEVFVSTRRGRGRQGQFDFEYGEAYGPTTRRMSTQEAQARLADVESQVNRIRQNIYENLRDLHHGSAKGASADQARRNRHGSQRDKLARATVTTDLWRAVDKKVDELMAADTARPEIVSAQDLFHEYQALTEALDDTGEAGARFLGEAVPDRPPLPNVTVPGRGGTVPGATADAPASAVPSAAVPEFDPDFFISYANRRPLVSRALPGNRQGMGVPKGAPSHQFTGGSVPAGTFRDDVLRVVAETGLERQRYRRKLRIWEAAKDESITATEWMTLPDNVRKHYKPVRTTDTPYDPTTRAALARIRTKADDGIELTRGEQRQLTNALDNLDDQMFPGRHGPLDDVEAAAIDAEGQLRFYDERKFPKARITVRGDATTSATRGLAGFADITNSLASISLLFTKGTGYITPNVMGQMGMLAIQQGLKAPLNLIARAPYIVRKLSPEQRYKLRAGSGATGISRSLVQADSPVTAVRAVHGGIADVYSKVLDQPWRDAAFIYEARRLGYTTLDKLRTLLDSSEGSAQFADLLEVRQRVDRALGEFGRMGQLEQDAIRRVVFFYPWIKASTLYTARMPIDHPVTTAGLVQLGREGQSQTYEQLGEDVARIVPGVFPTGDLDENGNPRVIDPRASAIFQSPSDILGLAGQITGATTGREGNPGQYLTPAVSMALGGLFRLDAFRQRTYPQDMTRPGIIFDQAKGLTPYTRMLDRMREGLNPENRMYGYSPGDALKQVVAGSQSPRSLIMDTARDIARDEKMSSLAPPKRRQYDHNLYRQALAAAVEKAGLGKLSAPVSISIKRSAQWASALSRARERLGITASDHLPEGDRVAAEAKLLAKLGLMSDADAAKFGRVARSMPEAQAEEMRRETTTAMLTEMLEPLYDLRGALRDMGVEIDGYANGYPYRG